MRAHSAIASRRSRGGGWESYEEDCSLSPRRRSITVIYPSYPYLCVWFDRPMYRRCSSRSCRRSRRPAWTTSRCPRTRRRRRRSAGRCPPKASNSPNYSRRAAVSLIVRAVAVSRRVVLRARHHAFRCSSIVVEEREMKSTTTTGSLVCVPSSLLLSFSRVESGETTIAPSSCRAPLARAAHAHASRAPRA